MQWPYNFNILYFQDASTNFNKMYRRYCPSFNLRFQVKMSYANFLLASMEWKMKIENFWNSIQKKIHSYLNTCFQSVKHFDKHLHILLHPTFKKSVYGERNKMPVVASNRSPGLRGINIQLGIYHIYFRYLFVCRGPFSYNGNRNNDEI